MCEECNLKVNSKNQLHSHKLQKHKTNKICMCEYCKKDDIYKHDSQDHIETHKIKEHEQPSSQYNFTTILKKQNGALEEMKQKDIKDHNNIEKLLEECRKDMLDDNDDDEL